MNLMSAISLSLMIVSGTVAAQESNPMPVLKDDLAAVIPKANSWLKSVTKPMLLRVGLLGGVSRPIKGLGLGATGSLRGEYGFSNKLSLMTNAQFSQTSSFQNSTVLRWMPFTSRIQPFVGAGWGFALDNDVDGHGHCHHHSLTINTTPGSETPAPQRHSHGSRLENFAVIQTGVNYSVSTHFILHAEAVYQTEISRHHTAGAAGLRLGLSYQFGKQ